MPKLVAKAISNFPEPAVVFGLDEPVAVFANPALRLLTRDHRPDVTEDVVDGMSLDELAAAMGVPWDESVMRQLIEGEAGGGICAYREEISAYAITTKLAGTLQGQTVGLVTVHARAPFERIAWLQHTRIKGLVEMALYVADARDNNTLALKLVYENHERLKNLEATLTTLVDTLGSHMLAS